MATKSRADLTGAASRRRVLRLAIPNIVSNITVPLLSAVDTAMMGRMPALAHLEAIALGGLIVSTIYWLFGFLRMGATGTGAQAHGRGDDAAAANVLYRALLVALPAGLLIILFAPLIADVGLLIADVKQQTSVFAREYLTIRFLAAPAALAMLALNGWFLGMQNARIVMILAIGINIVNILANLFFVYGLGLQHEGVAWGSVAAQYSGLAVALFALRRGYRPQLGLFNWSQILDRSGLRAFFSLHSDIFIRTLCLEFVYVSFYMLSPRLGVLTLAANQLLMQFWTMTAYGVDGFAFAIESLVGNAVGKRDEQRLRLDLRTGFIWAFAIAALCSLAIVVFGREFLLIFSDKTELVNYAHEFIGWMLLVPLVSVPAYLWDGAYIGATAGRDMRRIMIMATFGVFVPTAALAVPLWSNHGLWAAMIAFTLARAVFMSRAADRVVLAAAR